MYNLIIHKKARETLDLLKNKNLDELKKIISSLDSIKDFWINISNIKNIWNSIYRKRVWRYRILMTFDKKDKSVIHIWIIDLEKDTKKDYKKWKMYIMQYSYYD